MRADDPLSAVLAEVRARNEDRVRFYAYTEYTVERDVAEGDVRRLLAALDAALALHVRQEKPVRSWDHVCGAHRDARGFADPRQMQMRDCPDCVFSDLYVCRHCPCPNDMWPCPTYRAILAALTGKGADGGN